MKVLKNDDAAKKIAQRSVRGSEGESRSQGENYLVSGWQGSDEDEHVNIDSSDEEEAFVVKRRRSTPSALVNHPAEKGRVIRGRDLSVAQDISERSGPCPGGRSVMKVKSSDARRFRKELTANKSGAKMAVIPRDSPNEPIMTGSLASEKRDTNHDAGVEDLEKGEISPGKSPDAGNERRSVERGQPKDAGTGAKPDQEQVIKLTETPKRKRRDSKETSEKDDEENRKRSYRELEEAQLAADRKLTLRERPESRQRDDVQRREDDFFGRRRRTAGRSTPQGTDTMGRLRNENEVLPAALEISSFINLEILHHGREQAPSKTKIDSNSTTSSRDKHATKKRDRSTTPSKDKHAEKKGADAESAEKSFEICGRRFTRRTEKLQDTSPSKPAAETVSVSRKGSRDYDVDMGQDENGEYIRVSEFATVDSAGEPSITALQTTTSSMAGTETVEKSLTSTEKSSSGTVVQQRRANDDNRRNILAWAHDAGGSDQTEENASALENPGVDQQIGAITYGGTEGTNEKGRDGVVVDDRTAKDVGSFCTEALDHLNEGGSVDGGDLSEGRQQRYEEDKNGEEKTVAKIDHNLQTVETKEAADVESPILISTKKRREEIDHNLQTMDTGEAGDIEGPISISTRKRQEELDHNLQTVEIDVAADIGSFIKTKAFVDIDMGPKEVKEDREKLKWKKRNSAEGRVIGIPEIEVLHKTKSCSTFQDSEETRWRPLSEGVPSMGLEHLPLGAAKLTGGGGKSILNVLQKTSAQYQQSPSRIGREGPESEGGVDKCIDQDHAPTIGSAASLLEEGSLTNLRNDRISSRTENQLADHRYSTLNEEDKSDEFSILGEHIVGTADNDEDGEVYRCLAGSVALHDQPTDTSAVCALTIEDVDDDHSEEASEVDDHNSFCEACRQGGTLLCCDASGCKVTYHLECADPSMTEVPEGKWYCPTCTQKRLSFGVNASLKAVESIWDVRNSTCHSCSGSPGVTLDQNKNVSGECSGMIDGAEDRSTHVSDRTVKVLERGPRVVEDLPSTSTGIKLKPWQRLTRRKLMELESCRQSETRKTDMVTSTESADDLCKDCKKQYFVKYKNLSHLHNAWVHESELKKAAPKMLESFKKRLESDNLNQGRNKWQPNWQVPQRFLLRRLNAPPRRPGGGRGRGYLGMDSGLEWFVKWQDLGYEHCTWEQANSGLLDSEISKRLESDYDRWCEGARRRSHPARIEEVMRLREADFKPLDKQPDWFQGYKLSAHQLEELNGLRERWHHHHNTLMVDESDQERTRTAVAFLLSLIEEYGSFKPILVIVPLNGCQMWESELLRCAEHVYTVVYTGSSSARSVIQRHELNPSDKPIKFQIVLTTFEIANNDHDHLGKFEWEAVILDEGHRSRITKSYRHLQFLAPYRLILMNDFSKCTVLELQQFLVYLQPEDHTLESELQKQLGKLNEDNQLNLLKGRLIEKIVGDIRSDETSRLEFREHWIRGKMTQTQVHQYCTELSKHYNLLYSGRMRSDQDSVTIPDLIGNLRNVCNHPFLLDPHLQQDLLRNLKPTQNLVEAGIQLCGKFDTLQVMVSHLHANGWRVVLLCQTDKLCIYFDDYMRQIFGADSYECVSKGSDAVKNQAVQRFNAEDSTRFVLILRKNTAGVSLQLRETDVVIVYDSDWNPANDLQYLEKVIYKVQGPLNIYRLYTPLTVEEAAIVYSRQRRLELQRGVRTARYSQQILKWKVKEVLELDDIHNKRIRGSEKIYLTEFTEEVLKARAEHAELVERILDGTAEAEALSLNEEIPEEDGEALKEFWSAMLRDRYTGLQFEELTDRKRPRKRVHLSEESLALASYAAVNEEEVRRKRRRLQGSEVVQRGSPKANIVQSCISKPPALLDSSTADEILPTSVLAKEMNVSEVAPQEPVEGTTVIIGENSTSVGAQVAKAEEERPEAQTPMSQGEESAPQVPSANAVTKSAGGTNSTASEEGRKTRSEQQQKLLGLWRPDVTKICEIMELSEKVATYADQLLVYCMRSYRMPKEPRDLVLQVQIALCVVAAKRFHQETDDQTTLYRVEEAMNVKLKRESWSDNYQKIVSLCKGYPLPSTPSEDTEHNIQAQPAAIVTDTSSQSKYQPAATLSDNAYTSQSKPADDELSLPTPVPGSEIPASSLPSQDVDKPTVLQTPDCLDKANDVDDEGSQRNQSPSPAATGNHADERQVTAMDKELQVTDIPEVPSTLPAQTEDAVSVPEVQGVVENEILLSTVSQADKEQIHEKLKTERHEIYSVVMYQQAQELNEFYRSKAAEKQDMLKRNDEEHLRKFELDRKEQHETLVRRQRMTRDEIHSVYTGLQRQADAGCSRSLFEETQSILAKMGVSSVAEVQSILRAVADDARRKKAGVGGAQGPVGQVRNQTGRTSAQSQAPRIGESANPTQAVRGVSLPHQSVAQAGAQTQAQSLRVTQLSQPLPPQPPVLSEIQHSQILQPPSQCQPPLAQLQQSSALPSQVSQLTPRSPPQSGQPNSDIEAPHLLPPRLTMSPSQQYVPGPENAQSPHQQPFPHVPVSDSTPSEYSHTVGRPHNVQPSPSNQQQWTTQVRQPPVEQQRNLQGRLLRASPIPRQQPVWTGQGHPNYTRQQPQPQHASIQVHNLPSTVVSPSATPNSVAQFTLAAGFLPPIPPNMLGQDPILQEENRLKRERENIRTAHEQKAADLKMQYAREVEDAQRKFEALMAEMKKKFDGLLDENYQTYNQQNLSIQQTYIKVHRSRLLAEALRNRGMFDVRGQQGDESASGSGQMRNIQGGTAYAGLPSQGHVQSAQPSFLPIRHHHGANEVIITPSGQYVNAASPAGRLLLQTYRQNSTVPARTVSSACQRELSTLSDPPAAGRTPAAPAHSNSTPVSAYPGGSNVPGRGPPAATTILSSGRVSGLGGSSGVGVWQTCNPSGVTIPGSFVPLMTNPSALMSPQTSTSGSITMSVSTSTALGQPTFSSAVGQPTSDNSSRPRVSTSQNSGNVNVSSTTSQQRRSWTTEGTGNMTSHSTTDRMGSQPSLIPFEGSSNSLVHTTTNVAAAERLPVVTEAVLVSVNPSGSTVASPESCALGDWRSLGLPPPTPHPALPAMVSREPDLGGVAGVDGPSGGLVNPSNLSAGTNRPDVPVIYLSDDD